MSRLSQAVSASPLNEAAVSPLLWGTAASSSSPATNNNNILPRSNPIAIARNQEEDSDSDDGGDVVNSFQQLVLEANHQDDGQFCVGSLPTTSRRRRHNHSALGTSLPAAPVLRSKRHRTPTIPPISLTEGDQEQVASPSYGSLRESQLAGRFLDGPSSYREKSSGQIKKWGSQQKVRFQSSPPGGTPGERMQEMRRQQTPPCQKSPSSSLSAMLMSSSSSQEGIPQSSFVDHEYSLQQDENVLSTSLTGLELLQRGLAIGEEPAPDASHLSSWSSSGANTLENEMTSQRLQQQEDINNSLDQANNNHMSSLLLPDEEDEDHSPVFDLDME